MGNDKCVLVAKLAVSRLRSNIIIEKSVNLELMINEMLKSWNVGIELAQIGNWSDRELAQTENRSR